MADAVIVRYVTRPDRADENERLIRAVFAELDERGPDGFRYLATRLDDGVSFVHVATFAGDVNPLANSPAFAAFLSGIGDRCVEGPVSSSGAPVGSYWGPG